MCRRTVFGCADGAGLVKAVRGAVEEFGLVATLMRHEWVNGVEAHFEEGVDGAARFSGGLGRHRLSGGSYRDEELAQFQLQTVAVRGERSRCG